MNLKFLFNKENYFTSILMLIYFVFGCLLCILPSIIKESFDVFICAILLTYGTLILFANCLSSAVLKNRKLVITAFISIILGVLILFIRSFLVFALGCVVLVFAIFKIFILNKNKHLKDYYWCSSLVFAIIYFVIYLTTLILFILNKCLVLSFALIGICFICEAVSNLVLILKARKYQQQLNEGQIDLQNEIEEDKQ